MKKKRHPLSKEYNLVPNTAGKICAGVWKSKDGERLVITFAWGENLFFVPQEYLKLFPSKLSPSHQ